jgi:sigma-B regulation protein RsbU (phosphoserine phosphatase)
MPGTAPSESSSDRLALLLRLSQTFNSSLDLDEVLNRVMDEVIGVTGAERGFLMLHEDDGRTVFSAARGIARETIDDPEFLISRSVVERVAHDGEPIMTSDAQVDDRFSMRQSVKFLGLRSILCVPLEAKGRLLGVVYVDNRLQTGLFTEDDLDLLVAVASSAATAIENARLYKVAVEQGRMERELQVARELQASLLPSETPQLDRWDFAAYWRPAREVAGDYYDFIPLGDGTLGLVIADVSDKGMAAALFMALTRSMVRASAGRAPSPAKAISNANQMISADATRGMFVTLFYGELDPTIGQLTYVNAGHNPPLLYRVGEDRLDTLSRTGMALGVVGDSLFDEGTVRFNAGDFIVLYTDGVTDATDAQEESFGLERLRQLVLHNRRETAANVVAGITGAVEGFVGSTTPFDDVTIVVARCLK